MDASEFNEKDYVDATIQGQVSDKSKIFLPQNDSNTQYAWPKSGRGQVKISACIACHPLIFTLLPPRFKNPSYAPAKLLL